MDDDTTIVNIKGVRKAAWNAATRAASLAKTPYGPWISDAIDQRLYREARGDKTDGQAGLTEDQRTARLAALAELAKGMAALRSAGARAPGMRTLRMELAALMPPARLIRGQESVKPAFHLVESTDCA